MAWEIVNQNQTDQIISLFHRYGDEDYDQEPVSHTSHLIQCAMLAMHEDADTELILAAFLHDIGHLLRHDRKTGSMGGYGAVNHEIVGAEYLHDKGLSIRICDLIAHHVDAKRYLVAIDDSYREKLSAASLQTLEWQGGPMNALEIHAFRQHPFFEDIIKVRLWDERAKDPYTELLPLSFFQGMLFDFLNRNS
ncbi:MAG: HD domain-containing protein [Saprospiraceae bacterium]